MLRRVSTIARLGALGRAARAAVRGWCVVLLCSVAAGCGEAESDLATDWPSDTVLALNGTRLFVHQEGRGEVVVVLHGGPVLDHSYLVQPLRPLADSYRLVFFDQRLSGRSAGTVDSASVRLDTLVADIEELRKSLGVDGIHLMGHSWGGLLAMRYAAMHPSRLRSLMLISPMAPTSELWQRDEAALRASMKPADTLGMGAIRASEEFASGDPAAIARLLQLSFRSQLYDPALADSLHFYIPLDYGERSRQFGLVLPDLMAYDVTEGVQALNIPILVIYGEAELGAVSLGGADTLRALNRNVRVDLIPRARHFAFLERPAEFLSSVRRFLGKGD